MEDKKPVQEGCRRFVSPVFYYQAKLFLTHPLNCISPKCKKMKAYQTYFQFNKYQFNNLWFNVKFPNQFFKREEKSNDFFNNLSRKKFHLLWGLNIINVSLLMSVLELQRMPPTILLK